MTDPRVQDAPEVLEGLRIACASVRAACDPTLLELARRRVAQLLGNEPELDARAWGEISEGQRSSLGMWPSSEVFDARQKAALALTEQFVLDVTGVLAGPLATAAGELGAEVGPFVQGLYLLDVGQRVAVVTGAIVGDTITSDSWAWDGDAPVPADPMTAIMAMLAAVGRLQRVDPITKELVRLRGARVHQCRRCQSVRNLAAIDAGADDELLDAEEPHTVATLPIGATSALELVDATFLGQPTVPPDLRASLGEAFSREELVELTSYLLRNACNKIPVAFGVDDAIVDEGFEYQRIDEHGETLTIDSSERAS